MAACAGRDDELTEWLIMAYLDGNANDGVMNSVVFSFRSFHQPVLLHLAPFPLALLFEFNDFFFSVNLSSNTKGLHPTMLS